MEVLLWALLVPVADGQQRRSAAATIRDIRQFVPFCCNVNGNFGLTRTGKLPIEMELISANSAIAILDKRLPTKTYTIMKCHSITYML